MQDNTSFISIITVCYNSEATISRTIKSVLRQSFKDYEYIIIDGASKDNTLKIIEYYLPFFEGRLKYISEPDKGIYDAFSKGCRLAKGKYVWIVNSDDFLEPSALDTIWRHYEELDNKDAVTTFGMNFRTMDGSTILQVNTTTLEKCRRDYYKDSMGIIHPSTVVPKSVYEKVGYYCPDFKIIGDIDWFHRAYGRYGVDFVFRDEVITNMCDGGISNVFNFKMSSQDRKLFLRRKYNSPIRRWLSYIKWVKLFYSFKIKHKQFSA